jgi:hypothetical protein
LHTLRLALMWPVDALVNSYPRETVMIRRTASVVAAGALALGGVALLVPTSASAQQDAAGFSNTVADQVGAQGNGRARLLTPAQRRELRTTGHLTVTKHTPKHGTITVIVQRGEVTAISPTSISLKSKDGWSHTYVITDKTKVRERRQPVDLSELKVGERAMVVALQTKSGDVARRIGCLREAPAPAA